jgi:hypothetical protein
MDEPVILLKDQRKILVYFFLNKTGNFAPFYLKRQKRIDICRGTG